MKLKMTDVFEPSIISNGYWNRYEEYIEGFEFETFLTIGSLVEISHPYVNCKNFNSIPELVKFYSNNSFILKKYEGFQRVRGYYTEYSLNISPKEKEISPSEIYFNS